MAAQSLLLILASYLLGSVPSAYIAGRLFGGLDLRQYGSRSVSGSNVGVHISPWAFFLVGGVDIAKAALPAWVGLQRGLGLPSTVLVGLAAIIGHNWSLYLRFAGGRGISASIGVLLIIAPWGALLILASLVAGKVFKNVPLWNGLGMMSLPLAAWVLGESQTTVLACLALTTLAMIKRLEANRQPGPQGMSRQKLLFNRLLLDRDIQDRQAWVSREPQRR
jgi:glycerol-3-phosphate acyltransferase PlsY